MLISPTTIELNESLTLSIMEMLKTFPMLHFDIHPLLYYPWDVTAFGLKESENVDIIDVYIENFILFSIEKYKNDKNYNWAGSSGKLPYRLTSFWDKDGTFYIAAHGQYREDIKDLDKLKIHIQKLIDDYYKAKFRKKQKLLNNNFDKISRDFI